MFYHFFRGKLAVTVAFREVSWLERPIVMCVDPGVQRWEVEWMAKYMILLVEKIPHQLMW